MRRTGSKKQDGRFGFRVLDGQGLQILLSPTLPEGLCFLVCSDVTSQAGSDVSGGAFVSVEQLRSFTEILLPLLIQCWVEVGPSQLGTDLPGKISGSAAESRRYVSVSSSLGHVADPWGNLASRLKVRWMISSRRVCVVAVVADKVACSSTHCASLST